jgi:hypothetical protein
VSNFQTPLQTPLHAWIGADLQPPPLAALSPPRDVLLRAFVATPDDGVHSGLHALGDLLHVHISGRSGSGMPHQTLNVLHRTLLLGQHRNRSTDSLKGPLRQFQITSKFMKHSLAEVVRIQKTSHLIRRRRVRAYWPPLLQIVREVPRNVNDGQTLSGLPPRTNLALYRRFP